MNQCTKLRSRDVIDAAPRAVNAPTGKGAVHTVVVMLMYRMARRKAQYTCFTYNSRLRQNLTFDVENTVKTCSGTRTQGSRVVVKCCE